MPVRLSCLLLLGAVASPAAAGDPIAANAKAEVRRLMDATDDGDYDVLLELTHPKALEALGGREKAGPKIKAGMDAMKAQGYTSRTERIGTPTVAKGEKDHYAVVPYTLSLARGGKRTTVRTAVVGVSADGGKTWLFVNVSSGGEERVRKIFPDLPRELRVPATINTVE